MTNATKHPSRQALHRHLQVAESSISRHLKSCEDCRLIVHSMRHLMAVDDQAADRARRESLVQSILSVPALSAPPAGRPRLAPIVRDSWQSAMVAQLRHAAHGVERRLRFHVGDITVDLVADRLGDKWNCSMRISRRGRSVSQFAASLGKRKMLPVDVGFFSWVAKRPPKQIRLWSSDSKILLETIPW